MSIPNRIQIFTVDQNTSQTEAVHSITSILDWDETGLTTSGIVEKQMDFLTCRNHA